VESSVSGQNKNEQSAANSALFNSVLLIEDNASHAMIMKRALAQHTGEIRHATTFEEALSLLAEKKPDLIITDLHLGNKNALDWLERLSETSGNAPIIVLTVSTSLTDAVEAMKRGAQDFIVKSFDKNFSEILGVSLARVHASVALERESFRLQNEMGKLRGAIESSKDGLAVIDSMGEVVYSNSAFQSFVKLCGGNPRMIFMILSPAVSNWEDLIKSVERNLKNLPPGAVWHTEVTFENRSDMAFDLSLSVVESGKAPEEDSFNECVVWVRDISEQKRREKFQREILSTTTHDLKGPLGAILISSELVGKMVVDNEKASRLVLRMASSASGAINLIDEFLSARRIQEGNYILKPAMHKIHELISEVLENYEMIAAVREIKLTYKGEDKGLEVCVDRLGFSRVAGNIIGNALKFTPQGGEVKISSRKYKNSFQLQIKDSGCGMEPPEVSKIFERYSRLDRHSDVAGTGIGLFVVKSIVGAHGGKIDVTSKVGEGTCFDITFPMQPPVNERGELICLDFT